MSDMISKKSLAFFETQFQRQVRDGDYALNPFETLALDYLTGSVLDLGSGLGNLSLEAGRRGHRVLAVDASPTAVARIHADAQREGLAVQAIQAVARALCAQAAKMREPLYERPRLKIMYYC